MVSHPEQYHDVLQRIMKAELAGVMRYNHYALMVRRPRTLPPSTCIAATTFDQSGHTPALRSLADPP